MDRYLVISSDGHAGPRPEVYRDYLDPQFREEFDRQHALRMQALEQAGGVVAHASRALGMSRQALYRRMDKFGIDRA